MDVKGGYENKGYICFFEAIGTALLLIAINAGIQIHPSFQPFAIGMIIFANIVMFGKVTGGHFNPAVTIGILFRDGKANFKNNAWYSLWLIIA